MRASPRLSNAKLQQPCERGVEEVLLECYDLRSELQALWRSKYLQTCCM